MTVPGPADRKYEIDDNTPTLKDWTDLIVGEVEGLGALEAALHDLTGPGAETPVFLPVGFTRCDELGFTFQADVGGTSPADPTTAFYVNRGTSRTITITYVTNWTWSSESYIKRAEPQTSPELLSLLKVIFVPTGTITVT